MTLKELAYSTQQHLQAKTGDAFKRTHIYELLASSFGFNSYAAFGVQAAFKRRRSSVELFAQDKSAIVRRCVELDYPRATAEVVSSTLPIFLVEREIGVIRLSDLVATLRGESGTDVYENPDNDERSDDEQNAFFSDLLADPDDEAFAPILLESLEASASKGVTLAHYALALIHAPDEDDDDSDAANSYWHTQAHRGHELTGVAKEWADAHTQYLARAEKYAYHLREAARLGDKQALLDLADRFDEPSFFERTDGPIVDDPVRAAEIAERLGRKADARHWFAIAAKAGNTDAMRLLIEEYDSGDLQQCWKWLYLARLVGVDLTQSKQYAIHEDGSDYDDDVGGAVFVAEESGVELAALDKDQDARARTAAQELFVRIQQTG